MRALIKILVVLCPWVIKRHALRLIFKYDLHPKSSIGFSWIYPSHLIMEEGSKIGHFNIAIHLDKIVMKKHSSIGRSNWITGFSSKKTTRHFQHQPGRNSVLMMHEGAAITKHHHIDCTSPVSIGKFTTIAGYYSQLLTHSIDIIESRQDSHPISIGDYCFVSTNVVILGGAQLPDYSVLGAKSLLNKKLNQPYALYAGQPAVFVKTIDKEAKYFTRTEPFVY
jgi:acetyltransferase-like isoleucine patch superfamily enzyme